MRKTANSATSVCLLCRQTSSSRICNDPRTTFQNDSITSAGAVLLFATNCGSQTYAAFARSEHSSGTRAWNAAAILSCNVSLPVSTMRVFTKSTVARSFDRVGALESVRRRSRRRGLFRTTPHDRPWVELLTMDLRRWFQGQPAEILFQFVT